MGRRGTGARCGLRPRAAAWCGGTREMGAPERLRAVRSAACARIALPLASPLPRPAPRERVCVHVVPARAASRSLSAGAYVGASVRRAPRRGDGRASRARSPLSDTLRSHVRALGGQGRTVCLVCALCIANVRNFVIGWFGAFVLVCLGSWVLPSPTATHDRDRPGPDLALS